MVVVRGKHILVIPSSQVMTKNYPLGGIFAYNQARLLSNAGYKIGMISPNLETMRFLFSKTDYKDFEILNGIPIFRKNRKIFSMVRFGKHTSYILKNIESLCVSLYNKYTGRYGFPSLIHAHDLNYGAYCAYLLNKYHSIPYIITWHSSNIYAPYSHRISNMALEREVLRNASKVIAVSNAVAAAIKERYQVKNVHTGFNVLEPEFEYYEQPLIKHDGDYFQFISIGALEENKNHELLIKGFARAFKGGKQALWIGGTGHLSNSLKNLTIRLGISDQIEFLGHLNRNEVVQKLRQSDCLVHPSNFETFGVVLIEALSLGVPVISTRCGGADDIVNQTNGVLVESENSESLTDAMIDMVKASGRFEPETLRNHTIERYGSNAFVNDMEEIIRNS